MGIIAISIAMVKLSVPQSQIGHYEMLLFLTNLLATFWITGMIQALLPLYGKFQIDGQKSSVLFNAFILITGLSVLSGAIAFLIKGLLFKVDGIASLPFYNLVILYLTLSTPTLLIEYIYLLKDKPRQMIIYGVITHVLQVLLVIGPLLIDINIEYSVYGLIAISAIRIIWLIILIYKNSALTINKEFLKEHTKQGFPLALKYLISSSGTYIDQAIITTHFDSATFAIYRFGAREIPLIVLMTTSLSTSLLSDFSNSVQLKSTLKELKQKSLQLMHLLFPLAILTILLSKPLFPIIFSPEFAESANILMIYALIITSRAIFPQTVTMGLQRNGIALLASIVEMVLNIALSLLLLIPFGIEGVAMATVIVYLLEKVFLAYYNQIKLEIPFKEYTPVRPFILYSVATIAVYCIARFII
ncbi:MAG TPA: lipid II flippase MurJ [Tenuifilaceae bacterium]|nr:lipid II flippase MurJ [Tenuifilaceae bacterium]HPI44030.1 lipid II flippase MurJ [Tenuifilaceae bacterium]HPN20529.1 lipid II flippase MurJ [Tenuifilaceae bacterium]